MCYYLKNCKHGLSKVKALSNYSRFGWRYDTPRNGLCATNLDCRTCVERTCVSMPECGLGITGKGYACVGKPLFVQIGVGGTMIAVIAVVIAVLTRCFRHRQKVKMSSWRFNITVVFGCILLIAHTSLQGIDEVFLCGKPFEPCRGMTTVCNVTWLLLSLAVTFIVGPIVLKTYRIRRIFMADHSAGGLDPVEDWQLGAVLTMMCAIDIIAGSIYRSTRQPVSGNERWFQCSADGDTSSAITIFQVTWKVLLTGCGLMLMYQTRAIDIQSINDSTQLMYTLSASILCFICYISVTQHTHLRPAALYVFGNALSFFVVILILIALFYASLTAICWTEDSKEELDEAMAQVRTYTAKTHGQQRKEGEQETETAIAAAGGDFELREATLNDLITFDTYSGDFPDLESSTDDAQPVGVVDAQDVTGGRALVAKIKEHAAQISRHVQSLRATELDGLATLELVGSLQEVVDELKSVCQTNLTLRQ